MRILQTSDNQRSCPPQHMPRCPRQEVVLVFDNLTDNNSSRGGCPLSLVGPTSAITSDLQKLLGESWQNTSGRATSFYGFMQGVAKRLSLQMRPKARQAPVPHTPTPMQSLFQRCMPRERPILLVSLVGALQTDGWLDSYGVLWQDSKDQDPARVDIGVEEAGAAGAPVKRRRVDAADPAGGATTHKPRMCSSEFQFLLVNTLTMLQLAAVATHPDLQCLLAPHREGSDTHAASTVEEKRNLKIEKSSLPGQLWTTLSNEECMDRIASRLHFKVASSESFYDFLRVVNCHLMPVQMTGQEHSMQEHAMSTHPIIYSRPHRSARALPTDENGLQDQSFAKKRKLTVLKQVTGQERQIQWLLSLMTCVAQHGFAVGLTTTGVDLRKAVADSKRPRQRECREGERAEKECVFSNAVRAHTASLETNGANTGVVLPSPKHGNYSTLVLQCGLVPAEPESGGDRLVVPVPPSLFQIKLDQALWSQRKMLVSRSNTPGWEGANFSQWSLQPHSVWSALLKPCEGTDGDSGGPDFLVTGQPASDAAAGAAAVTRSAEAPPLAATASTSAPREKPPPP